MSRMAIIYGDSNAVGYTETRTSSPIEYTADADGNVGALERIWGPHMPLVNWARGSLGTAHSDSSSKFARRFAAIAGQRPTDLVLLLGRNDIGVDAATTLSRIETCIAVFKAQFPSIVNVVLCTLPPTTQGDWTNATPSVGQTLDTQSQAMQVQRVLVNAAIRAKTVAGQTHCLDMAARVEVNGSNVLTQDGQYWKANSTLDGIHYASSAHIDIADTYPLSTLIP